MYSDWRPVQGSNSEGGDWRAQLDPEARSRIVNKIVEVLKKRLPVPEHELEQVHRNELHRIAVRFEERIYTMATSQPDYLRKISIKLLPYDTKRQEAPGNAQVIPNQNTPVKEDLDDHVDGTNSRHQRV